MIQYKVRNIMKTVYRRFVKVPPPIQTDFLENVFETNFSKKVLISYITSPFILVRGLSHTNLTECYTAAQIFNKNGYQVDVVQYTSNRDIDYTNYEVVYGFGEPFEKVFYSDSCEQITKIVYIMGCSPVYLKKHTVTRLHDFAKKTGLIVPQSARINRISDTLQFSFSDLIISFGGEFTKNTYLEYDTKITIEQIDPFYFDSYDIDLANKNFSEAKKHFLWFGSSGLIHKGLDLLIDVFSTRNDVVLHICGDIHLESKFLEHYQTIIDKCDNIIAHGFVDIDSVHFQNLMNTCAFTIFPSLSEGGAVSVLTVMGNGGLIPIVTLATGIDNLDKFGLSIDSLDAEGISNSIDKALKLDEEIMLQKANLVKSYVRSNLTQTKYNSNLERLINQALRGGHEK